MFTIVLFTLSGVILATLMIAKRMQEKAKRNNLILSAISRGDAHVRELHHQAVHFYSIGKEKAAFFVKKQLPMRSRISVIKILNVLRDTTERYVGDIRGSKLLKKSDGISEFFKNMSEVEKGNGEINEAYEERGTMDLKATVAEPEIIIAEIAEKVVEEVKEEVSKVKDEVEEVIVEIIKPKKPRAPRKPRVAKAPEPEPKVEIITVKVSKAKSVKSPKAKTKTSKAKKSVVVAKPPRTPRKKKVTLEETF